MKSWTSFGVFIVDSENIYFKIAPSQSVSRR